MQIVNEKHCKVAICIPSYNNTESMARLLQSIREQTYLNFAVIISDDTQDNSIEKLIENYIDIKIYYYHNEQRLGASVNCNKAICYAELLLPEYIKVMHHDDFFTYDYSLSIMVSMLETHPNADIMFTGTEQVRETDSYSRCISLEQLQKLEEDYRDIYLGNMIGAPSAVLMRNKKALFDESLQWLVDVELYLRLLHENAIFVFTTEPLISIGISSTQLTNSCKNNQELLMKEYLYVYKKLPFLQEQKYSHYLINKVQRYMEGKSI